MENFSLLPKLPELINPGILARDSGMLQGHYIADSLTNLSYGKIIGSPCIACKIYIQRDNHGKLRMAAEVNANLELICQNCFEALQFEVAIKFDAVLLLESEVAASKEFEIVLLRDDGKLALQEIVNEEIILQLPLSPRHNKCISGENEVLDDTADGHQKPFADLNRLLNKN